VSYILSLGLFFGGDRSPSTRASTTFPLPLPMLGGHEEVGSAVQPEMISVLGGVPPFVSSAHVTQA
jgi:hypothetical protein